jgi:hypothetical protein
MSVNRDILLSMTDPLALQKLIHQQDSVVSCAQALQAGLSRHAIAYRLRDGGPWRTLLPGTYLAVPGVPTQAQQETAAILYGGPYAVITAAAALRFYQFGQVPQQAGDAVDILIPARFHRMGTGFVRVHRTWHMPAWARGPAAHRYASPARAVADKVRWLGDLREVRALVGDAVQNRHCTVAQLSDELRVGGAAAEGHLGSSRRNPVRPRGRIA